jgi:ribose 5-phosphate isomerase A
MHQDEQKALVAKAAVNLIMQELPQGGVIGIGTGSTVNFLIDELAMHASHFRGVVSSSHASTSRLLEKGFTVLDPSKVEQLMVYVDGADEINPQGQMIKGGGGALTREKIVAAMSKRFICICDASKEVAILGKFPLPIEVIPLASFHIQKKLEREYGVKVQMRHEKNNPKQIFVTDNQAWILDVHDFEIKDPKLIEQTLNQIPGVICNGIFAMQSADTLIISDQENIRTIHFKR